MNSDKQQKYPILNDEWEITNSFGDGLTSKVYLAKNIKDGKLAALKLFRQDFIHKEGAIQLIEKEIQILSGLKHSNITAIYGYGDNGTITKPSGRKIENNYYILLEYVNNGILFDVCQSLGGMGEEYGRFLFKQLIDAVEQMHSKGVIHRDLKLENILIDDNLNMKLADFGFATFKKIKKLQSYRGTKSYMAPEIKESKQYNGKEIDIFSCGVILFIIVQGIFPFVEAKKSGDFYYNLIFEEKYDVYWKKVGGENLSNDFKDLILKMFSYDSSKRPSIEELRNHPWMQKGFDHKKIRSDLVEKYKSTRSENDTAISDNQN